MHLLLGTRHCLVCPKSHTTSEHDNLHNFLMTLGVTQIYPYTLVTLCQPNNNFNFLSVPVSQSPFILYSLDTKLNDKMIAKTTLGVFCYFNKTINLPCHANKTSIYFLHFDKKWRHLVMPKRWDHARAARIAARTRSWMPGAPMLASHYDLLN